MTQTTQTMKAHTITTPPRKLSLEERLARIDAGMAPSPEYTFRLLKEFGSIPILRILEQPGYQLMRHRFLTYLPHTLSSRFKTLTIAEAMNLIVSSFHDTPISAHPASATLDRHDAEILASELADLIFGYSDYMQKYHRNRSDSNYSTLTMEEGITICKVLDLNLQNYINVCLRLIRTERGRRIFQGVYQSHYFSDKVSLHTALMFIDSTDEDITGQRTPEELLNFVNFIMLPMTYFDMSYARKEHQNQKGKTYEYGK